MEEERDKGTDCENRKRCAADITCDDERKAKDETGNDAVAGAQTVDAVNEVYGIDDSHARKDGQRDSEPIWNCINAPQTMEVVDGVIVTVDQKQDNDDLDDESYLWSQSDDIVHCSDIEHYDHSADHGEQIGNIMDHACSRQSHRHTEEDSYSAENRYGYSLQLSCIRIINYVLELCNPQNSLEYPPRGKQGHDEERDVVKNQFHRYVLKCVFSFRFK